jgi:hypothetical protein
MVFFGELHVFLYISCIIIFRPNRAYLQLGNVIGRQYSFKKPTQISQGNHVVDASVSNTDGFLSEIHVFPEHSHIGPFGTK